MKMGIGTNIFSKDWDLLIILDCCRVDALIELAPEYDFIGEVNSIRTVGGSTPEWTSKTFSPKYREQIQKTGYVSGTGQVRSILEEDGPANSTILGGHLAYKLLQYYDTVDISDLAYVDYAFEYDFPEDSILEHPKGKTPPRYVTDRGIKSTEKNNLIVSSSIICSLTDRSQRTRLLKTVSY